MIKITTDVFCDNCGDHADIAIVGRKVNATKARQEAKRLDWLYVKRRGQFVDLCPDCANPCSDFCGNCGEYWPCVCDEPVRLCGICSGHLMYECQCDDRSYM